MTDADDLNQRINYACRIAQGQTLQSVSDVLATGCMANELAFDCEPPTVTLADGLIVVSENFRFI